MQPKESIYQSIQGASRRDTSFFLHVRDFVYMLNNIIIIEHSYETFLYFATAFFLIIAIYFF